MSAARNTDSGRSRIAAHTCVFRERKTGGPLTIKKSANFDPHPLFASFIAAAVE